MAKNDTEIKVPETQPNEDAAKIVEDAKAADAAATEGQDSGVSAEEAAVEGDRPEADAGTSEHLPPPGMMEYVEVGEHLYKTAADEFQRWLDKGETPDGSRCDMAALTPVVAWLRAREEYPTLSPAEDQG